MSASSTSLSLQSRLAVALPSSVRLTVHHVVSDVFACPEIFAAPPEESPETTSSESHFLSAAIVHRGQPLQVFALEVYIYTTDSLTTIFVSKADSTGYLHLLELPEGTPSPIKTTITTFLDWLVEQKSRKDARLLLSLFARAQNQYLFPGSIENEGKHVLDDRGLIRWWCRVLDPLLLKYAESEIETSHRAHAHLIVPGLDAYETRSYFLKNSSGDKPRWKADDPLKALGKPADLPVRCYIPRFPDDPKARFVIDLDDELPEEVETETNRKGRTPGIWKSVKSLSQFWELMSFRQECSAGRLVGFVWAVFEPIGLVDKPFQAMIEPEEENNTHEGPEDPTLPTPLDSQQHYMNTVREIELSGVPIIESLKDGMVSPLPSSQPEAADDSKDKPEDTVNEHPEPAEPVIRGKKIGSGIQLNDEAYKTTLLLLETLDYSTIELALESTNKFIQTASKEVGIDAEWGMQVIGETTTNLVNPDVQSGSFPAKDADKADNPVNMLGTGMIKSRKRQIDEVVPQGPEVRVLSSSSVRKKSKA